jgi:hypothetical protein
MAATYVTANELRSVLGVGTLYPDSDLELACQTAEDTLNQYLWFDSIPVIGSMYQGGIATLVLSSNGSFTTGQTLTITNSGTIFNGAHVLTGTYPYSTGSTEFPSFSFNFPYAYGTFPRTYSLVQFTDVTGSPAAQNYKTVVPYGKASGVDTKTTSYAATPAIRQAALMLAVDVWQARQAPSSGGVSVDGVTPSPYRLGNTMLAKVRGLIAPYTNPRSMVG